jgi:phage terminase small subunit
MKTDKEQLTLQQQRFCDEYLVSFNAVKAAIKAGYSENTARKCELLHLPKVQAYLQAGMQRTSERLEITHDMILRELAKVAFANMGDYYDENAVLKPINQLTSDQKAAISHYQLIDCIGDYQERAGEISKIKLHNKLSALDKIARHVGFYRSMEDGRGKMEDVRLGRPGALRMGDYVAVESESREDVGMRMGDYVSPESEVLGYDAEVLERGDEKNLTLSPPGIESGGQNPDPGKEMAVMADEDILTLSPVGIESTSRNQEPGKEIARMGRWSPVRTPINPVNNLSSRHVC